MNSDLVRKRERLFERHDAAVARWPDRSSQAFLAEMQAVAGDLEDLAQAASAGPTDRLEAARTWRAAGMAWYDAAGERQPDLLRRALAAYERADELTDREVAPVDGAKNDYCTGRALLNLGDDPDSSLARKAVERFSRALAAARRHAPEFVPSIEPDLIRAERVLALRGQTDALDDRMAEIQARLRGAPPEQGEDIRTLFETFSAGIGSELEKGDLAPERRVALEQILSELGELVARSGRERTREEMDADREELSGLMRRMIPLLGQRTRL